MDPEAWAALVAALLGVGASTTVAILTVRRQARLHREQLAAAKETFDHEQRLTEQRIRDAVEREHFARLWEVRKDSYSRLAAWLVDLREHIERLKMTGAWTPPAKLDSLPLGQVIIYGHLEIFASAEILRGGLGQMLHNAETFADQLPEQYLRDELDKVYSQAYSLLLRVREAAIALPDWSQPLLDKRSGDPQSTFTVDMDPVP
jgi:hypothetical protein